MHVSGRSGRRPAARPRHGDRRAAEGIISTCGRSRPSRQASRCWTRTRAASTPSWIACWPPSTSGSRSCSSTGPWAAAGAPAAAEAPRPAGEASVRPRPSRCCEWRGCRPPKVERPRWTRNHLRGLEDAKLDEPSKHPQTDAELTLASGGARSWVVAGGQEGTVGGREGALGILRLHRQPFRLNHEADLEPVPGHFTSACSASGSR